MEDEEEYEEDVFIELVIRELYRPSKVYYLKNKLG